jgi:endonuclease YncB( thermonuclease family)
MMDKYINAEKFIIEGTYKAYVLSCHDGDTFTASICWKGIYLKFNFRLYGIDAYEITPKKVLNGKNVSNYDELKELGKMAKEKLEKEINGKFITINCHKFDLYNRVLANITHVYINEQDENKKECNVVDEMIKEKLGFSYFGSGPKEQHKYYLLV